MGDMLGVASYVGVGLGVWVFGFKVLGFGVWGSGFEGWGFVCLQCRVLENLIFET